MHSNTPPLRESSPAAGPARVAYTVAEVAALTGIGTTTLWNEVRTGRLSACRVSARVTRLRPADVDSWLARAAQPTEVTETPRQRGRRGR